VVLVVLLATLVPTVELALVILHMVAAEEEVVVAEEVHMVRLVQLVVVVVLVVAVHLVPCS
jgi:hypothetical protein